MASANIWFPRSPNLRTLMLYIIACMCYIWLPIRELKWCVDYTTLRRQVILHEGWFSISQVPSPTRYVRIRRTLHPKKNLYLNPVL